MRFAHVRLKMVRKTPRRGARRGGAPAETPPDRGELGSGLRPRLPARPSTRRRPAAAAARAFPWGLGRAMIPVVPGLAVQFNPFSACSSPVTLRFLCSLHAGKNPIRCTRESRE